VCAAFFYQLGLFFIRRATSGAGGIFPKIQPLRPEIVLPWINIADSILHKTKTRFEESNKIKISILRMNQGKLKNVKLPHLIHFFNWQYKSTVPALPAHLRVAPGRQMANKYVFTYFNDDDDRLQVCVDRLIQAHSTKKIKCGYGQRELTPSTNKKHLQGFIVLTQNRTLEWVKRDVFGEPSVHLQMMRGTIEQNIAYVHKSETSIGGRFKIGDKPKQGTESKWKQLKAHIDQGRSTADLWVDEETTTTMAQYHKQSGIYRKAKASLQSIAKPRAILYIVGPTGAGKSSMAYDYARGNEFS